jgi:hypothetical protein
MKHRGGCHCGKVAFEVEGDIDGALACNCSMCHRKGSLLWFVGRDQFNLLTPPTDAAKYTFNKHAIEHYFCKNCGIQPFALGVDPKGNKMAAIILRCVDGIEIDNLAVRHFNGRAL